MFTANIITFNASLYLKQSYYVGIIKMIMETFMLDALLIEEEFLMTVYE
jgi:hypothetical protein